MKSKLTGARAEKEIRRFSNVEKVLILKRFFKTGPGEYGEGDVFIGVTVPQIRSVAKKFIDLELTEVEKLLRSKVHEIRLLALLILVLRNEREINIAEQRRIYRIYIKNVFYINNWDLIDLSAPKICGEVLHKDSRTFNKFINSKNVWHRRIAILSTFACIKQNKFEKTLSVAKTFLKDKEDLIHKAVGWMLREVGKKDQSTLIAFLNAHYKKMPRTMLRYSIERFPETVRKAYLLGNV